MENLAAMNEASWAILYRRLRRQTGDDGVASDML